MKLNIQLMQEMGLEEGERRRVIDQDTGKICSMGSREIVTPGSQSGKNSIEFDVINNPRMMSSLFSEFVDKLSEEGDIEGCMNFGSYLNKQDGTMTAKLMFVNGETIQSKAYNNEALCYADLVFQLNGEEDVDLKKHDKKKKPKKK